jgi:hypothetical protein
MPRVLIVAETPALQSKHGRKWSIPLLRSVHMRKNRFALSRSQLLGGQSATRRPGRSNPCIHPGCGCAAGGGSSLFTCWSLRVCNIHQGRVESNIQRAFRPNVHLSRHMQCSSRRRDLIRSTHDRSIPHLDRTIRLFRHICGALGGRLYGTLSTSPHLLQLTSTIPFHSVPKPSHA